MPTDSTLPQARAPSVDPKELFAEDVARIVGRFTTVEDIVRVPGEFALDVTHTGGRSSRLYLDSAFAETRELSPDDRARRIAAFFGHLNEPDEDISWDEACDRFEPTLRSSTFSIDVGRVTIDRWAIRRPFLPFLEELVAIDGDTSIRFVGASDLGRWGKTRDELFAAVSARRQVLASPQIELLDDTHGPLWIVASNDSYESSRLLVPGWLKSFEGKVEGRPIAIVPDRGTLVIGGDARPEMIARMLDKAEREFAASTRSLSMALYTCDDAGAVIPYAPTPDHPLANRVRIAHEKLALYEYRTQKEVLDADHEANDVDIFVASYSVYDRGELGVVSLTTWSPGVHTYLPKAAVVVLSPSEAAVTSGGAKFIEVPFARLLSYVRLVPDLHPARYETLEYPSDAELAAMHAPSK